MQLSFTTSSTNSYTSTLVTYPSSYRPISCSFDAYSSKYIHRNIHDSPLISIFIYFS